MPFELFFTHIDKVRLQYPYYIFVEDVTQIYRDGLYGACFLQGDNAVPVIYCARPGSRLWEVCN